MADSSVPRLNMAHGFVKSIVKNQIDRDDFDKNEKLRAVEKQTRKDRTKRKAREMYVPPHLRTTRCTTTDADDGVGDAAPKTDIPEKDSTIPRVVILQLFLELKSGSTRKLELYEGEDMKETVKTFALESGLDDRLRKALLHKVKQAIGSRSS